MQCDPSEGNIALVSQETRPFNVIIIIYIRHRVHKLTPLTHDVAKWNIVGYTTLLNIAENAWYRSCKFLYVPLLKGIQQAVVAQ